MNVKTTRTLGKLITLSLITSTMIHATNGDNLIAVGTKARGMGGIGIAMSSWCRIWIKQCCTYYKCRKY